MALKDCLYTLEDHPELLAAFKKDMQDGLTTNVPSYIKTLVKNLTAEKRDIQLNAIGIKRGIGYIEDYVKRAYDPEGKRRMFGLSKPLSEAQVYKRAIENLIGTSYRSGKHKSGITSIEAEADAFRAFFHADIADMMSKYRPRKLGFERSVEAQDQLVHGLYGSTTDVDAKAYAKSVVEVFEKIRTIRNSYGGNVEKLDNYNLPQTSDAAKVAATDFVKWKEDVKRLVNPEMLNEQVQRALKHDPNSTAKPTTIDKALEQIYNNISTNGAASAPIRSQRSGLRQAVSSRHTDHRFFHFKNADAWLEYNKLYGKETPYVAITNHIDRMSREIAAMKILGAHPEKNLTYLASYVDQKAKAPGTGANAHTIYKTVMGEMDGVPHPQAAAVLSGIRDIQTGTKLGSAAVSALTDNYFLGRTAYLMDMPLMKTYAKFISNLVPGKEADRIFAGSIGLSADYAVDKLTVIHRMSVASANNWTARFADASLRMTGLNYWTQAVEHTFKMEFAQYLTTRMGDSFENLGKFKDMLDAYGVTKEDWGVLRNTPSASYKGSKYFDVTAIDDLQVMAKVQGMILSETAMAAPRPTARVKAFMHGSTAAGTIGGEVRRSVFQFKGFPMSIIMNQWSREFTHNTAGSRMAGLGSLVLGTTALGMISYNVKEIAKGRTPLDWASPELVFNGFIQGGSAGLLGDALFLDPDKQGGLTEFVAGPVFGEVDELVRDFILKPMNDVMDMEGKMNEHLANAALDTARRYVPSPLNLPFVKTAFTRATIDQLRKQTTPDWYSRRRRLERTLKKDRGQEYWWKPGNPSPNF